MKKAESLGAAKRGRARSADKSTQSSKRSTRSTSKGDQLVDLSKQPVSNVRWRHRDELRANDFNPNHVAPTELELLITSILADGYTQPIVVLASGVIVDGFHRHLTAGDDRLLARYGGMVPTVEIKADRVHHQMSTIRHNRARGVHGVKPMASIVREMVDDGVKPKDIQSGLGMEDEEVDRLIDRSGMPKRATRDASGFGRSFVPQGAKVKKRRK